METPAAASSEPDRDAPPANDSAAEAPSTFPLEWDRSIKVNLQIPSKSDVQIIIYKYIKNAIYSLCHSLEREY